VLRNVCSHHAHLFAITQVSTAPAGEEELTADERTVQELFARVKTRSTASAAEVSAEDDAANDRELEAGATVFAGEDEDESVLTDREKSRIANAKKYPVHSLAQSSWRASVEESLAGVREARAQKRAEQERVVARLDEAVALHKATRASLSRSLPSQMEVDGGGRNLRRRWCRRGGQRTTHLLAFLELMAARRSKKSDEVVQRRRHRRAHVR
jgi:hypothetical protein